MAFGQMAGAVAIAGMMFCGGFLSGQLESAGKASVRSAPSTFLEAPLPGAAAGGLGPNDSATDELAEFRAELLPAASLERLRKATAMEDVHPVASLVARDGLASHQADAEETHRATAELLEGLSNAFRDSRHHKLLKALSLLAVTNDRLHEVELAVLAPAAEHLSFHAGPQDAPSTATKSKRRSKLTVSVAEQPFGMHIAKGSTLVDEVFPGFPAQRLGVRKGCSIAEIAGKPATAGTWLEQLRQSKMPFKLSLECGAASDKPEGGGLGQAEVEDPHRFRVMVTKKPYGMNIQVNTVPRVVEVLPGYPAEAAGLRRGFVLTEVAERPVTGDTWFQEYQSQKMPFTLTFDTQVPVQADNPYFNLLRWADKAQEASTKKVAGDDAPRQGAETTVPLHGASLPETRQAEDPASVVDEELPTEGFEDFRCSVDAKPFGMHVASFPGRRPRVESVMAGSLAEQLGVRPGHILVEVAGRPVNSITWFAALQQARPPFGLLFKRQTVPAE